MSGFNHFFAKKRNSKPVSRVLYSAKNGMFVIYLEQVLPLASCNLPPGIGRAILKRRCTRSCSPRFARLIASPQLSVCSYHAFSPLHVPPLRKRQKDLRLFSSAIICPHEHLPVRKLGALRCSDFPLFLAERATNRLTVSGCKDRQ